METTKLLENQVAIVTGGASGIGKEIALEFAREGAIVIIADLDKEKSAQTLDELKKLSAKSISTTTDISQESNINNLIAEAKANFGKIDILVNNAGIGFSESSLNTTRESWEKVIETNLTGSFFLSQKIAELMISTMTKGKIIFITSIHQEVVSLHPQYSASKAALVMIVKELALELSPFGIQVNGIAPGAIRSREDMSEEYEPTPLFHQRGKTLDIARMSLVLASDYFSRYMTGEIVKVDGGLTLIPPGWRKQ